MRGPCSSFDRAADQKRLPRIPSVCADDAVGVSLARHFKYQQMDPLSHGPTDLFRNAIKTIRILMNERREYLVGIFLLLIVVFLWALSNFVTQVCVELLPPTLCVAHCFVAM